MATASARMPVNVTEGYGGFGHGVGVGSDIALQPDGKILVVDAVSGELEGRDFALVRYNSDGTLDGSFDDDGVITTNFATYRGVFGANLFGSQDDALSVALQPDGKILVAGRSFNGSDLAENIPEFDDYDFALARYNGDGSLDTAFGNDGKVTTAIGFEDDGFSVALQPDGKILVAGSSSRIQVPNISSKSPKFFDFALVRYNEDGSLDTTFDGDGIVTTHLGEVKSSSTILTWTHTRQMTRGTALHFSRMARSSWWVPATMTLNWR